MRTIEICDEYKIKKICCIGAGYVGGPTCAVIADRCPSVIVTVVDKSQSKISSWLSNDLPVFEPGLLEIVKKCKNRNLFFSTDVEKSINEAELIFIAVDTPTIQTGPGKGKAVDLTNLEAVARLIGNVSSSNKIVVEKSTVPVKAAESIKKILAENCKDMGEPHHVVISNPEFLSEGSAIKNLLYPDRVLIGVDEKCESGQRALESLKWIYSHWLEQERIIVMSTWSSELSKLAANAFLAQRISSINSLTAICEMTGADIRQVAESVGRDSRIGPHFFNASIGFGGSCFQKDILNLIYLSECLQLPEVASYWQSVIDLNNYQKQRICDRICTNLLNNVQGKKISIWGFAFKKDTFDTRESPAIAICKNLLNKGARLAIFDPKVTAEQIYKDINHYNANNIEIVKNEMDSIENSNAIVICTEWEQFKNVDYEKVYEKMNHPAYIFDGRLIVDHERLRSIGFTVEAVGINFNEKYGMGNTCNNLSRNLTIIDNGV